MCISGEEFSVYQTDESKNNSVKEDADYIQNLQENYWGNEL